MEVLLSVYQTCPGRHCCRKKPQWFTELLSALHTAKSAVTSILYCQTWSRRSACASKRPLIPLCVRHPRRATWCRGACRLLYEPRVPACCSLLTTRLPLNINVAIKDHSQVPLIGGRVGKHTHTHTGMHNIPVLAHTHTFKLNQLHTQDSVYPQVLTGFLLLMFKIWLSSHSSAPCFTATWHNFPDKEGGKTHNPTKVIKFLIWELQVFILTVIKCLYLALDRRT